MIDRPLQVHLEPIARDYHYWHLWRALARCWTTMALVGIGLILLHRLTGWWAAWVFPLFIATTVVWAAWIRQRWRRSKPDYRAIARQIEQAGVAQAVDRLSLDGMLALWRPAGTN